MRERRTYLDHNATAPLRPEARAAMLSAFDQVGNPSSVHAEGRAARTVIEDAREAVADLVGCKPREVVFTSGATESNNCVLRGGWDTILMAGIEHDAVQAPARACGARIVDIPVLADGTVDACAIADHVLVGSAPLGRDLVTLQLANSETGVLQDVAAVSDFCGAHDVALHCDAAQAPGRVPIAFADWGLTFLSLSAHKLGGPKGVGALVIKDGLQLPPLMVGGGQERRQRAGTENVAAIAGFGAAAVVAKAELGTIDRLRDLRDRLEHEIRTLTPAARVLGEEAQRLANTTAVALPGTRAETLVIKFDMAGVAISAGSACSSGKVGPSATMQAMDLPEEIADAAIRVSFGWTSSERDLEPFLSVWQAIAAAAEANAAAA